MAYECPRCGGNVSRRGYKGMSHQNVPYNTGGTWLTDLVGSFFFAVLGGFECKECGKIPRREFPYEVRAEMSRSTMLIVLLSLGFVIGVAAVLFYLR
jgi:hypothetical protein